MGILEVAILGGIAWLIFWTVLVFLQTALYALLSGSTAFASYYVLATPVDPQHAQAFMDIMGYGVNTVDVVALLLVLASWKFLRRFWECAASASRRFLSPFTFKS